MKEKCIPGKKICSRIGLRADEILWLKHSLKKFFLKKIVEENFLQKKAVRGIHHFLHTHVITLLIFVSTLLSQLLLPLRLEGEETLK